MTSGTTIPTPKPTPIALNQKNTLVIDTIVRPIYPVRYAYANFFEEELLDPARPPALSTLMGQTDLRATQGYVARLLRPGWIYIKEETGGSNFHIFRYKHLIKPDGTIQEQFHKYLFSNLTNARGGLTPEKSGGQIRSYPFAFVRKDVSEISIVYCEEPLSDQVIDDLNGHAQKRKAFMQRVKLQSNDEVTVEATVENLKALVEDYREQQNRLLRIHEQDDNPDIEELDKLGLDILTTQSSYEMDANQIAQELQRKTQYGEVARIVGLYDPVGIQKDIAEILTKLTLWEKYYSSSNLYPYTIGSIVQQLKESDNSKIKDLVEDNIDLQEHERYWNNLENKHKLFEERKSQFAQVYQTFMNDPVLTGHIGSLDTYFKHAFCEPQSSHQANEELQKFCSLVDGIFNGVLASEQGRGVIRTLHHDFENDQNSWWAIFKIAFIKLTTTPQTGVNWAVTTSKALDVSLGKLGTWWGEAYSWAEYETKLAQRNSHKSIALVDTWIVEKFIPKMFDVFGLTVSTDKKVILTSEELGKVLAKAIAKSIQNQGKQTLSSIKNAEAKQKIGQKLFDWGQRTMKESVPKHWELSKVEVRRASTGRYQFAVAQSTTELIGVLIDSSFAGLSAFFNVKTMHDLSHQGTYSRSNPLKSGSSFHDLTQFTSALASLTTDAITISGTVANIAVKSVPNKALPYLAQKLAPKLVSLSERLGLLLAPKLISGLVAVANLAAAVDAFWNATISFRQGNYGEMTGHIMIGTASAVLFGLSAYSMAVGGAAAVETLGIGLVIGTVVALLLLIAGAITVFIFGKSDFELLLENCFWGSGQKYLFWVDEEDRPNIIRRIQTASKMPTDQKVQTSYQLELQEFMNYFYQPQMEMSDDAGIRTGKGEPRTYHYTFKLPGFVSGVSDINYQIYTYEMEISGTASYWGGGIQWKWMSNPELTEALQQAIRTAVFREQENSTNIELEFTATKRVQIQWSYQPQPGIVTPRRYLTENGLVSIPIIGMIDEDAR
ncbi:toxin VasX [Gynuella sunshinyii]|uniref:Tetrahydromethanopterin S-methyltransferase, subunit C n=1 Tax=Gynuella sunshinyii YC6258 TaxID=1445510 RepID=A0A0C5W5P6_9GAMM|nr:toxin VasX [Gynuella sunshinyii]AJQ97929.1 tetrahydromethanopterin S-methyltransferase, subunit C [Gynuella sunshinyii YC6258]